MLQYLLNNLSNQHESYIFKLRLTCSINMKYIFYLIIVICAFCQISSLKNKTTLLMQSILFLKMRRQNDLNRQHNQFFNLIDNYKDFCSFKEDCNRRVINQILSDRRFSDLLKKKISLQCHSHQKNCLTINWKEFDRPTRRVRDRQGRSLGKVIKRTDNKVTIELESEDDSPNRNNRYQRNNDNQSNAAQNVNNQNPQTEIDRLISLLNSIRASYAYKCQLLSDNNQILLKTISNISFTDLNILHLSYCNLTTIEPLSKITAPNLRDLSFQYNRITDIRVLRKIETKGLKYIATANYEPEGYPFGEVVNLPHHFPVVSYQLLKAKYESAYYKKRPIWGEHFRKLMQFFQALDGEDFRKKRKRQRM